MSVQTNTPPTLWDTSADEGVLFRSGKFAVCSYNWLSSLLLMHECKGRTNSRKRHRVIEEMSGHWVCTCCGERPPEDVVTVHILMDGARLARPDDNTIHTPDGEVIGEVL